MELLLAVFGSIIVIIFLLFVIRHNEREYLKDKKERKNILSDVYKPLRDEINNTINHRFNSLDKKINDFTDDVTFLLANQPQPQPQPQPKPRKYKTKKYAKEKNQLHTYLNISDEPYHGYKETIEKALSREIDPKGKDANLYNVLSTELKKMGVLIEPSHIGRRKIIIDWDFVEAGRKNNLSWAILAETQNCALSTLMRKAKSRGIN